MKAKKSKMSKRLHIFTGMVVTMMLLTSIVRADSNYAITLSNGTNYAVFTLTFTGDVTGLQLTSPEGYVFNEENAGAAYAKSAGKIQIGVRYAESGKWKVLVSGNPDDGFRILVSSDSSFGYFADGALPPTEPTPTTAPEQTETSSTQPTIAPTPTPTASPTPTAAPTPTSAPTPTVGATQPSAPAPSPTEPSQKPTQATPSPETTTSPIETTNTISNPTLIGPVVPSETTPVESTENPKRPESQKGLSGIPVINLIEEAVESTPWLTLPILAAGLSGALVISFIISYAITRHVQTKKYISQEWAEINYEEGER